MDFERILTVLEVWHKTFNVVGLETIRTQAFAELLEHQNKFLHIQAESPDPELPLDAPKPRRSL